ncbi:MAG TPA: CHAT domain-containing protein [Myxococcaceae bacterium]|nr:CHAT domain-containing protein [Myxococcaceae bacterium]
MPRHFLRPWVQVLVLLGLGACTRRAVDECSRAYRGARPAEAVAACTGALARTRGVQEAGALAYSHYAAGQPEQARALLARYGTPTGLLQLAAAGLDWRSGKTEGAAERLGRAARACRTSGDSVCATRAELETAALALTRGEHRAALEASNRAADEPAAKEDPVLASRALTGVFDVLLALGDAEGAERVMWAITELKPDDQLRAPYLALKEGVLQQVRGRNALARRAYLRALEAAKAPSSMPVQWSARLNLVEIALQDGHPDEAALELGRAESLLPEVRGRGNSELAYRYYRAWLLRAQGDHRAATEEIGRALELGPSDDWAWMLELERAQNAAEAGDRPTALAATRASIDALERLRTELGLDELKAWLLPTRRKPFELRFRLQAEQGDTLSALETAELSLGRTLLDAFIATRTAASTPGPQSSGEALARAEILRDLIPALRAGPVTRPGPIAQVLRQIRHRHVLVYLTAGEAVWRFDIRDGRPMLERLALGLDALATGVGKLRSQPADATTATELGGALLPRSLATTGEELTVVASDAFSGLPFCLLRTDGQPLFQRHAVAYVPSLGTLAALMDAPPQAVGAPVVMADAAGDLPGARDEGVTAGRVLGVKPLLGPRARRDELQGESQPSVIHLALHGGVGPLGSWLSLADGELRASDVLALRLQPRLAVLSACASAATRVPDLWGSMSAAFLAGGARDVLGALWSVQDAETRAFVERFYAEGGARRPASALARTQRWLAEQGAPASTWAAFVVLGL